MHTVSARELVAIATTTSVKAAIPATNVVLKTTTARSALPHLIAQIAKEEFMEKTANTAVRLTARMTNAIKLTVSAAKDAKEDTMEKNAIKPAQETVEMRNVDRMTARVTNVLTDFMEMTVPKLVLPIAPIITADKMMERVPHVRTGIMHRRVS